MTLWLLNKLNASWQLSTEIPIIIIVGSLSFCFLISNWKSYYKVIGDYLEQASQKQDIETEYVMSQSEKNFLKHLNAPINYQPVGAVSRQSSIQNYSQMYLQQQQQQSSQGYQQGSQRYYQQQQQQQQPQSSQSYQPSTHGYQQGSQRYHQHQQPQQQSSQLQQNSSQQYQQLHHTSQDFTHQQSSMVIEDEFQQQEMPKKKGGFSLPVDTIDRICAAGGSILKATASSAAWFTWMDQVSGNMWLAIGTTLLFAPACTISQIAFLSIGSAKSEKQKEKDINTAAVLKRNHFTKYDPELENFVQYEVEPLIHSHNNPNPNLNQSKSKN